MMRSIVGASLKFRLLVVALGIGALVLGVSKLRAAPVDVLPEYVPPTVEIQTEALGLSAAEVEQLITVPMEQDLLAGVAFLDDIRSESLPGLSRIFLVFEPGTDLYRARQVVAERLTQAHALPNVSKPPQMMQPLSSTNRVMMIGASSESLTPIEMGVLARWTIAPKLVGVEGVANVSIWGFRDRQLQVQVDPKTLRDRGVSLVQVVETAGNALWFSPLTFVEASTPGTGGFIDTPNQRLGIQHLSPLSSAADLAKVRVESTGDRELVLGDVAKVVEDHQPLIGDAFVNDGDGELLFVVEKLPQANTLAVTDELEEAVDALAPGLTEVQFDTTVYRPASFIESAVDNLRNAGIAAALLMALIIGAFLFRWRTALVALFVIPLSLVVAGLVLWLAGTTINTMVVLGLVAALALVVDDAVVGVESVVRRLREHRPEGNGTSRVSAIVEATLETRSVTAYATLIVALALLPLFFFDELAGAFLPDVAGAFVLALAASLLVAVTVTPALAALLLARAPLERESPLVRWLQQGYERTLAPVVAKPRWTFGAAAVVFVASLAAVPFLSTSLLPAFKERQLLVRWDAPPGTSLQETKRVVGLASSELRSLDGVQNVGAHVGRAVGSDLSVNTNSAEIWVNVDPSADYEGTVSSIRDVVGEYPGLSTDVASFSSDRARTALANRDAGDLVVRVYGESPEVLSTQAERVRAIVSDVDGAEGATVLRPPVEPTVEIEVDLAAAERRGIKPGDVRRAAATLLGGLVVGNLFEQQKVFEVVVWGTPSTRSSLTSIQELLVDTPSGGQVQLGEVADVRIAPNPTVIERHAVSRYLDVAANVGGRGRDAVAADVRSRLAETQFPLEYHTEILGSGGQPVGLLIALAVAAAIGVILLLQVCFGSWRLAALCSLTFPLSVTGGLLAAALAGGGTISFGSVIALFAVFGLAVRQGMLLIHRFRWLEEEGAEEVGPGLVLRGARERVAPVLMTALASGLALLPLVVTGSIAGQELAHPLAVVMVGGLITSTMLTLFVVPVLYLHFGPSAVLVPEEAPSAEAGADLVPPVGAPTPAGAGAHSLSAHPGT